MATSLSENNGPTRGFSRQDFINSSHEVKLVHLYDVIVSMSTDNAEFKKNMTVMNEKLVLTNSRINKVIDTVNAQTDLMKSLTYKSIDLEARSRRNNLLFRGFIEQNSENCANKIFDFLSDKLDIDVRDMYIARAHRLGAKSRDRPNHNRPIIVAFRDFCDTELIMSRARMLKNTPFSIDFDLPREIQAARSKLWPLYKELKRTNPGAKVMIAYPAKLIMNQRLVKDEMPEWGKYINYNRLSAVEYIDNVSSSCQVLSSEHNSSDTSSTVQHHAGPSSVSRSPQCTQLSRQQVNAPEPPITPDLQTPSTSNTEENTVEYIIVDQSDSQDEESKTLFEKHTNNSTTNVSKSTDTVKPRVARALTRTQKRASSASPYGRRNISGIRHTDRDTGIPKQNTTDKAATETASPTANTTNEDATGTT